MPVPIACVAGPATGLPSVSGELNYCLVGSALTTLNSLGSDESLYQVLTELGQA